MVLREKKLQHKIIFEIRVKLCTIYTIVRKLSWENLWEKNTLKKIF
jgi:hypothetical protein